MENSEVAPNGSGGSAAEHEEVPLGSRINLCLIRRNSCQWSVEHESDSTASGSRLVHMTSTLRCTFEFLINDPSWDWLRLMFVIFIPLRILLFIVHGRSASQMKRKNITRHFMFFMASRLHLRITVEGFSSKQLHLAGSVTELPFYNVLQ